MVNIAGTPYLTQKDLAFEWGVTRRTVQYERKRWKLKPAAFIGLMPCFRPEDVRAVNARRLSRRLKQLGIAA